MPIRLEEIITGHGLDAVALIVFSAVTVGYFTFVRIMLRHFPTRITQGHINQYRHLWVIGLLERDEGVLAVQTCRNQLMSASFLASTAILMNIGLLNMIEPPMLYYRNFLGVDHLDREILFWWSVKVVVLLMLFSYAFFNFLICIRDFNYLSFITGLHMERLSATQRVEVIQHSQRLFDHAGMTYMRGLRGYFFALPVFAWFLSPVLMLAGTAFILYLQLRRDLSRLPADEVSPIDVVS